MIDEEKDLVHGQFDIDSGGHIHADRFLRERMNAKQVEDMVEHAKRGHSAHFRVDHNGHEGDYKLNYHGGKLKIHSEN